MILTSTDSQPREPPRLGSTEKISRDRVTESYPFVGYASLATEYPIAI